RTHTEFSRSVSGGELRLVNGSGKFGMSPIRPNPSVSHIRIEYDLIETGRTKIALMDLLGREVKIVRDEDEKPGHYAIDVSLGEMSSGYYLSTLRTPTQITMQPFVLQK
ncbi:MAG: T9SS type A sorting domain-containing protein, partial [Bacteroidota bacterium]|nr:T9SS type A sorting domain-containing protein [Bacteroidota bacterium]